MNDGIDFQELQRRARAKEGYDANLIESDKAGQRRALVTEHPLDTMKARKLINERQHAAGDRLRQLYETGSSGLAAMGFDGTSIDQITHGPKAGHPEAVTLAWAEYARIIRKLSVRIAWPLVQVCCFGEKYTDAYRVKPDTRAALRAQGKFETALDMLADLT